VRVRGLKLVKAEVKSKKLEVAPRAGAWIETGFGSESLNSEMSHPVRVRGLKQT